MLEVEPTGQRGRTATERQPEVTETKQRSRQKHSLGGFFMDIYLHRCPWLVHP